MRNGWIGPVFRWARGSEGAGAARADGVAQFFTPGSAIGTILQVYRTSSAYIPGFSLFLDFQNQYTVPHIQWKGFRGHSLLSRYRSKTEAAMSSATACLQGTAESDL
jgi:hypothetical protein